MKLYQPKKCTLENEEPTRELAFLPFYCNFDIKK